MKKTILALAAGFMAADGAYADLVAHFPMDVLSGQIVEQISGERFDVEGNFAPENVAGAVGKALRFDGYTSHVDARLGNIIATGSKKMTFSAWVALPCYPIIQIDTDTSEQTAIVSCLDETAKTGFGFFVGFDGSYSFRTFVGGWPVNINVNTPLPVYQWNCLTAVVDCENRKATLYNNGEEVGSSRCTGSLAFAGGTLYMGQSSATRFSGPFELMSFNGLIDDVKVWNDAVSPTEIASWKAENEADLNIPSSRFADDKLRPRFHGMPAAGWTNECHGLIFSGGRYHLFFQKNADGPFMARLHWGHISSDNLYKWTEEPIALAPGTPYDIKGCWSGCVFSDEAVTGGRPGIIYTAVDYVKATIAQASPTTADLNVWEKSSRNPIIGGRPNGLSDDFRDPYFFRNGDNAYIIVGSSKGGVGTTTLHRYVPSSSSWTNDGDTFFTGTTAAQDGSFWEMPTVTDMGSSWLFTATPLSTSTGTRTLYWTGAIDADGHFKPVSKAPRNVELITRDGFGLLSPTIYRYEGKTIALGIVPDKLPSSTNWELGWAHCYSLPREWSLDADGSLIQKPLEGLSDMRTSKAFSRQSFSLNGTLSLNPVEGRQFEIEGRYTVGSSPFGFSFFKGSRGQAKMTYRPSTGELTFDFSALPRYINDQGVYNGIYRCYLPEIIRPGAEFKINMFVDGSILDVFINDKWATSIRVFPTEADADGVEAFAEGSVDIVSLKAWCLDPDNTGSGIDLPTTDAAPANYNVYSASGVCLRRSDSFESAIEGLPSGFYIIGGRKMMIR